MPQDRAVPKTPTLHAPTPGQHPGGGFTPRLLGSHPGVSCDATGQCPLLGTRYQLRADQCDAAAHPHGYDVCSAAFRRLTTLEQAHYDLVPPPCMEPLVYAAGSREHRTYVLMGLVYM